MRIAYLSLDVGVPVSGTKGASIHLREVIAALRGLGHEVRLFSPTVDKPDAIETSLALAETGALTAEKLEDDLGHVPHLASEVSRLLRSEQAQALLEREFQGWRPDFIYERYSLFGYAGLDLSQRLGIPLILEVNAPLRLEQERYRQLALPETAEALERATFERAGSLMVVSEALAQHAVRNGAAPEHVAVLPNAVNPERFSPEIPPAPAARAGMDRDARQVGFIGSLRPWHDVDTLVDAVGQLRPEEDGIRLLIVGEGPRMPELEARGLPFVMLAGAVHHDAVPAYLTGMDVVAVPYGPDADEYFSPIKLFEAMAAGRPVVGARIGQVAEVIEDGVNGLLYEPGDVRDLADKLGRILGNVDLAAALGREARTTILGRHTWRRNAERIVERAEALISLGARA